MPDLDRDRELVERLRALAVGIMEVPGRYEAFERAIMENSAHLLVIAEVGLTAPHGWGVRFEVERENGIIEGERHERANVVAWLRSLAREGGGLPIVRGLYEIANGIERGAHVIPAGVVKPEAGA